MNFAWPHLLWLLFAPAGLLAWDLTHRRRAVAAARPKILRAEAGPTSLRLTPPTPDAATRSIRPRVWLCAGIALALLALARPQWGRLEEPVFDQSREILLAVDLSRSMLTPDVKPSRLDRAKLLIQSLLAKLAGERVGLVVFAGTSFLQAPLSADYEILSEFLPALNPGFLPEGGTNYSALLETSLQAFGTSGSADRFLIVLSDGEATDSDWKSRLEEFKKKEIRVIALGVGTAAGGMIPDGSGQLVKDERGAVVLSKLESATLQELAQATGGVYRDASKWIDLAALVNETIEAGRKGDFVEKHTVRFVERFQWPLAFGLWCLLVSLCYEFPVRPRPRNVELRAGPRSSGSQPAASLPSAKPAAAALAIALPAALLLLPLPGRAAAKLAPAPAAPAPARSAEAAAAPESSALSKIVSRLSAASRHTARDWAELGRETVTWGSRLQSQHQPVPEGPVQDALGAVDLGEKLDAHATDWAKLRGELEALLKKPDEDQQQPQKQEKQDQNQQQDQKDKDQQQQQQQGEEQDPQQPKNENQPRQDQKSPDQPESKPEDPKKSDDPALGDLNKKEEPPPPPPENTQQVGGNQEKKEDEQKEQLDPALALPLQKLEQLRNQDSPAQLFKLMEGDRKPAKKPGKDW